MRKLLNASFAIAVVALVAVLITVSTAEARGRRSSCCCAPAPAAPCCVAAPVAAVPAPSPSVAQSPDVRRSFSYEPAAPGTAAAVSNFSNQNYAPRVGSSAFLPKSDPNKYNGIP